jgi:hypothetical protein
MYLLIYLCFYHVVKSGKVILSWQFYGRAEGSNKTHLRDDILTRASQYVAALLTLLNTYRCVCLKLW